MLKLAAPAARTTRHQCDHCVVRSTGLCNAFADGSGLELSDLEAAHLPVRVFDGGDIIYSQGDSSDCLYCMVSGWASLHQDMPDGRRHISRFLLPGALFGVTPKGARHSHGATTITTASICAIPRARMDALRELYPTLNERFIEMLEHETQVIVDSLTVIAQGSSLERVAILLWGLAERICAPGVVPRRRALRAPLTQRLIADATGLTAIHVNRVIRRLREQALVKLHDGILIVEDPARLAEIANSGAMAVADRSLGVAPLADRQATVPGSAQGGGLGLRPEGRQEAGYGR
jgi:CRP/FNR family transcriptional regulator, anaerobic regulatory protein